MEKEGHLQLELFSQSEGQSEAKPHLPKSLLSYLVTYEKVILAIICFVIIGIVSFSLGVKKGRRLATKIELPASTQVTATPEKERAVSEEAPAPAKTKELQEEGYTVQVASYQTKKYAEKEAEALKRKGLSPLVLSKGKHTIVCVGTFSNKEKAGFLMSELKKQYQDCFVRRL